ncbi:MAG: hypothetical protein KDA58_09700, partial [Planctomycetaceae bacterium]|nr:hypothetical protein [Planctomycetaceae bacterium]
MSGTSQSGSPLPLPCSAFENYMVLDEWPSHPMVSYLECELQGPLDVAALEATLPETLARHPLLTALMTRHGRNCPVWIPGPIPRLQRLGEVGVVLPPLDHEFLDLTQEPGCRLFVDADANRSRLLLLMHHACTDALGMLTFLADWLNAYGHATTAASGDAKLPPLPPPNWSLLAQREDLRGVRSHRTLTERLRRVVQILRTSTPRRLSIPKSDPSQPPDSPATTHNCEQRFDEATFRQLRTACRERGLTLNDLLTTAMLLTIGDWEQEYGTGSSGDMIRLIIPVSRRTEADRALSAVNKIGYKFLSRMRRDLGDDGLLAGVHQEMEHVRRHRVQIVNLLKTVRWMQRLGLTRWLLPKSRCFATAVFSNLGDVATLFSDRL